MLPSIEEERERFFAIERAQQENLIRLIGERSSGIEVDPEYRIGAGDDLEINVFDVPELNLTARVKETGFITLPLVGAVAARGKTEAVVAAELRNRLASFVRNPQVSLAVVQYGSQKVSIFGAVERPGSYPLKKGANTLVEVLGEAGGISQRAGSYLNLIPAEYAGVVGEPAQRARLALQDVGPGEVRARGIEIFLDRVLGTGGGVPVEVPIRAGDMIVVPEAGKVTVEGEVYKTGTYELGRQMTMLGALAAAGGLTMGGKLDEVEIVREFGIEQKTRLVVDLTKVAAGEQKDVRLRNGDIVRVPSDSSRRFRQDTYEALGRIINFGVGGQVNVVP
jgi:polysaccharide export outer membrane protein